MQASSVFLTTIPTPACFNHKKNAVSWSRRVCAFQGQSPVHQVWFLEFLKCLNRTLLSPF